MEPIIYFPGDAFYIDAVTNNILKGWAEWLQLYPDVRISLEENAAEAQSAVPCGSLANAVEA